MAFLFKDLKVYRKAVDHADKVIHLTRGFPVEFTFLKDQFRRAATSICLNIAEGNGKFHQKERNNYFVIARSSCCECVPIVDLCVRNQLITNNAGEELEKAQSEIFAMLNGLIKGGRKRI